MVVVYGQGLAKQSAPEEKPVVERKNTWRETFVNDCAKLEIMWFDMSLTLEDMRKRTHWRSLGQISKVARYKLSLPCRFKVRKDYAS